MDWTATNLVETKVGWSEVMRPLRHAVNLIDTGERDRWHLVDTWQRAVGAATHQGLRGNEQEMVGSSHDAIDDLLALRVGQVCV